MNIAVTASLVAPLGAAQTGGAQAFLCDLALALRSRGHRVTVYCAAGSRMPGVELVTVSVPAAVERARVRPAGPAPAPVPALAKGFQELFEAVRAGGHDAISQHAFDTPAIELAEGLPVLHTLHLPPLAGGVVDAARRSRARFVTVSRAMGRAWRAAGLSRLRVIRDGVPAFPDPRRARAPVALIAGRVSPEKGTGVALRVAERAGLAPVLAGVIYDREYWRREVGRKVRALPRPELWKEMSRASVTLLPVRWDEPFGLVAAESQLAGCPVVGYRRGGLPEQVPQGVGGFLVEPDDLEALVAAVPRALELDRAAIRRSALRRLTIGPVAARYERALAELAAT